MTYFGGLIRRVVAPATDTAPEVLEDDETFRQRIALSPESWSTCGPEGAYLFWAVSASGDVLDAAAWSEDEGVCLAPNVRVVVLARPGMNQPEASLRAVVQEALNRRERRPIGDRVAVESASALPFDVAVTLKVREGVSPASVVAAAEARLRAYCEGRRRAIGEGIEGPIWLVGRTLYRDSIAGRAYGDDPNIVEVVVTSPVADVNAPAAGYAAGLASVGSEGFEPLAPELTAHLFRAPRLQSLTVTAEPASGGTFA